MTDEKLIKAIQLVLWGENGQLKPDRERYGWEVDAIADLMREYGYGPVPDVRIKVVVACQEHKIAMGRTTSVMVPVQVDLSDDWDYDGIRKAAEKICRENGYLPPFVVLLHGECPPGLMGHLDWSKAEHTQMGGVNG